MIPYYVPRRPADGSRSHCCAYDSDRATISWLAAARPHLARTSSCCDAAPPVVWDAYAMNVAVSLCAADEDFNASVPSGGADV